MLCWWSRNAVDGTIIMPTNSPLLSAFPCEDGLTGIEVANSIRDRIGDLFYTSVDIKYRCWAKELRRSRTGGNW